MKRFIEFNAVELKLAVEEYLNRRLMPNAQVNVIWCSPSSITRFEVEDRPAITKKNEEIV